MLVVTVALVAALSLALCAVTLCALVFDPAMGPATRTLLRALPSLAALCAALGSRALHPRDRVACAAVAPTSELLAGAIERAVAEPGARANESHALVSAWVAHATRQACDLPRASLARTALRRSAPTLGALALPLLLALAWPARIERGMRALFLPGSEWDGARVARVAVIESVESVLAGQPPLAVEIVEGRATVPAGGLLVMRGRLVHRARSTTRLVLREVGTQHELASSTPDPATGAFELALPLETSLQVRLETENARGGRTREPRVISFVAVPDAPPEVRWSDGNGEVTLDLEAQELPWVARDDRGLMRVSVVVARAGREVRRPAAYPEPGTRELSGDATVDPTRVADGAVVFVEATDDGGATARSIARPVRVLGPLDRRMVRVSGLRRVLDAMRALAARRRTALPPQEREAALEHFRALEGASRALGRQLDTEAQARVRDPQSGGVDSGRLLSAMRDRLGDLLAQERDASDPEPAPVPVRAEHNEVATRELEADAAIVETLLRGELSRVAAALARAMRERGADPQATRRRIENLSHADREGPVGARARAALGALEHGADLASAADLLSPPGSGGAGPDEEAAQRFGQALVRTLSEERAILNETRAASGPVPTAPQALRREAEAAERLHASVLTRGSNSSRRLATRLAQARDALRAGDVRSARALLEAAREDAWALDGREADDLESLSTRVAALASTPAQRAALVRLAPRQGTNARAIASLREQATRAGAREASRLLMLAQGAADEAREQLACGEGRAASAAESRSVAALEELISQNEGSSASQMDERGEAGIGRTTARQHVEVPPPEAFAAPRARRRAVVDALREGAPGSWLPAALRYARWLLR